MKRKLITIYLITILGITSCLNFCITTYAVDPMDPLNSVAEENAQNNQGDNDPNAMAPAVPGADTTDSVRTEEATDDSSSGPTAADIKKESAIKKGVRVMDTIMYVLGALCCVIPLMIIGIYALASAVPAIFDPMLNAITFGRLHYTDISPTLVLTRCAPIIIFGLLLAGGTFKGLLGKLWYFVGNLIY